jgi:hypothetical protein
MASKNDALLPDETDNSNEDVSNIRVNFSEEEASSEARDFDPLPGGKYLAAITDYEVRRSTSEKNNGKPYWALTLTIKDEGGKYDGRKVWANVMLFEGALYSLSQLLKATGYEDRLPGGKKAGQIPSGDELLGKEVVLNLAKQRDTYKEKQYDDGEKYFKNEVKGFKSSDALATSGGEGSLLP